MAALNALVMDVDVASTSRVSNQPPPLASIGVILAPASIAGGIIIGGRQLRIAPPPAAMQTSPAGQSAAVAQTRRPIGHVPASVATHAAPAPAVQQTSPAAQLACVQGGVTHVIAAPAAAPAMQVWPAAQSAAVAQRTLHPIAPVAAQAASPPARPSQQTMPAPQLPAVHGGAPQVLFPPPIPPKPPPAAMLHV